MRHRKPTDLCLLGTLSILFAVMPATIAAADRVVDVTKAGVVGDGKTLNTASIQKAIDECAAGGGGVSTPVLDRLLLAIRDSKGIPASERSVASVLGTPLGAWIGGTFGWRWTMALMAVLSVLATLWLLRRMPRGVVPPPLSASAWRQTLLSPTLMLTLGITVVSSGGQFVLFTYMAPYVSQRFGLGAAALSSLLLVYGLCGFVGNAAVSRWIDRIGPPHAMAWALGSIALGLGLVGLTHNFASMVLAIVPWGLGVFASNSSQQARLVNLAPVLAPASIALNTSAMYAGQAIGAGSGGWLIQAAGITSLPAAGCIGLICALGLSLWAGRQARRHPVPGQP